MDTASKKTEKLMKGAIQIHLIPDDRQINWPANKGILKLDAPEDDIITRWSLLPSAKSTNRYKQAWYHQKASKASILTPWYQETNNQASGRRSNTISTSKREEANLKLIFTLKTHDSTVCLYYKHA